MNKEKKLSLRLGIIAGLTSLALLGSTAGSLAWFIFSRTVSVSFIGTSVASSSLLNIGLIDTSEGEPYFNDHDLIEYDLEREEITEGNDTKTIYWSRSRSGFSLLALTHYLEQSPYAVDKLHPVTTGSRTYNDTKDFALYRSPERSETVFSHEASLNSYTVLPFAFRIIDENSQYVANKNVWLTEAVVEAQNGVDSSLRIYVDGANKFLIKPSDTENHVGETKVGGLLALGPGGYYDKDSQNKEYCYGEFVNTPTYSSTGYPDDEEHDVLVNVNGVDDVSQQTTFLAKHHPGVLVPDIAAAVPKVQEHCGMGKVIPSTSPTGQLYVDTENGNGIPIATTTTGSKIGYATFTIFIEGWDHSVIDQLAGYAFNLGLKFEIDRS